MHIILFLLAGLVAFSAFSYTMSATTSIHQIYAGIMWIIATLLLVGAAIVGAVHQAADKIAKQQRQVTDASNPASTDAPPAKQTFWDKLSK